MSIITQIWNNSSVSFASQPLQIGKYDIPQGYVNATEMCKSENKTWSEYRRLVNTQEYIDALSTDLGILQDALIVSISGGANQGTWVNPEIAIDLAAWISPKFRVWINRQIKTLLTVSRVELPEVQKKFQQELKTAKTIRKSYKGIELLQSKLALLRKTSPDIFAVVTNQESPKVQIHPQTIDSDISDASKKQIKETINMFDKISLCIRRSALTTAKAQEIADSPIDETLLQNIEKLKERCQKIEAENLDYRIKQVTSFQDSEAYQVLKKELITKNQKIEALSIQLDISKAEHESTKETLEKFQELIKIKITKDQKVSKKLEEFNEKASAVINEKQNNGTIAKHSN